MSRGARVVSSAWAVWLTFASVCAQSGVGNHDQLERAVKVDDKGFAQWAEHVPVKCPSCAGAGKTKCATCADFDAAAANCPDCKRGKDRMAVCRACAGTGSMPDPLEKARCPTCVGAAFLLCTVCAGAGQIEADEGEKPSACPCCHGQGGFPCGACNGDRLVALASLKPSLREGDAPNLAVAIAATEKCLADVAGFAPVRANTRKSVKALVKAVDGAQRFHPALKRMPKVIEDYMGKIFAGEDFEDHEDDELAALEMLKANAMQYLAHQKRMLELAHERAKANAKLAAERKGK